MGSGGPVAGAQPVAAPAPVGPYGPFPARSPVVPVPDTRRASVTRQTLSVLGTVVAVGTAAFSSAVAMAFAAKGLAPSQAGWSVLWLLVGLGSAGSLMVRRHYPVGVCLATAAAALVVPLDAFAPLLALTWVYARSSRRTVLSCTAAVAVVTAVSLTRDLLRDGDAVIMAATSSTTGVRSELAPVGYLIVWALLLAASVGAGLVRRYEERAAHADRVATEQATAAADLRRQALGLRSEAADLRTQADVLRTELTRQEERDLIAREMHDTVAHHLSLVSLHAAALEVTAADPATDVEGEARSMREQAHRALEEMRVLVASLRDAETALGPAPALADLSRLIGDARAAGAQVSSSVFVSDESEAAPALTRAVYRIVQESLTNVLKHAPGAYAQLELRARPGAGVDLEVRNRFAVAGSPSGQGGGAGLTGMRERAEALGGTFEHGVSEDWFVVRAHLPWEVSPVGPTLTA